MSVTPSGAQVIGDSSALAISADGRLAFFCSGNIGREPGVFVHDLRTRTTRPVSTAADGRPLSQVVCLHGKVASANGRFVAFVTRDPRVTGSGDYHRLVVKDRRTGELDLLTPGVDGQGVGGVHAGAMSASGRYLTFATSGSNLVPGDTNHVEDVFWFDRTRRATMRLSLRWDGSESFTQFGSHWPAISADGRWVTWQTADSDFMPGEPRRPNGEETTDVSHPRPSALASPTSSFSSLSAADHEVHPGVTRESPARPRALSDHTADSPEASAADPAHRAAHLPDPRLRLGKPQSDDPRHTAAHLWGRRRRKWRVALAAEAEDVVRLTEGSVALRPSPPTHAAGLEAVAGVLPGGARVAAHYRPPEP